MEVKIHPDSGINKQEILQIIEGCSYLDSDFKNLSPDEFSKKNIDGLGQFALENTLSEKYLYEISDNVLKVVGKLKA